MNKRREIFTLLLLVTTLITAPLVKAAAVNGSTPIVTKGANRADQTDKTEELKNIEQTLSFLPKGDHKVNPTIPTPTSILGFEPGEQYADWNDVKEYMRELERSSERVSIEYFGKSYQQRPFFQVVITSKENQKRLQEIRREHLLISEGKKSKEELKKMPVVVNIMSSIHGNEASGVNSSLILAYYFTAAQNQEILNLLDSTIIILTPGLNPDGINRFASWVNTTRSFNHPIDLNDREFTEPWPSSRTNHYFADCNRDWISMQHPEGRYPVQMYRSWLPNIVIDQHEQGGDGKGYFFSPGHPLRVNPETPKRNQELTSAITNYMAQGFDKVGTLYYSKEGYDDYFSGKGATYGDMAGSIAILVEQVASRGFLRPSTMGPFSFKSTILNQAYAGYYAIIAGYQMRTTLLEYQDWFFKESAKEALASKTKGYLFTIKGQRGVGADFITNLLGHDLELYKLTKELTIAGKKYSPANSYIVPAEQKFYKLVKTIWEDIVEFEDTLFYDISTWTLPRAYNIQYDKLSSTAGLLGERVTTAPTSSQLLNKPAKATYAYLFNNSEFYTPKMIYQLLNQGVYIRIATKSFTVPHSALIVNSSKENNQLQMGAGSFVVPVSGQPMEADSLYSLISKLAIEANVEVHSLKSGLMNDFDLGSPSFKRVEKPEIAIIVGRGMGIAPSGEVWHLLDQKLNIPATLIEHTSLASANLDRYNIIIMADGNLTSSIVDQFSKDIGDWISRGGTLISTGSSLNMLQRAKLTKVESPTGTGKGGFNGVILEAKVNRSSPLTWGVPTQTLSVLKTSATTFSSKQKLSTALSYTESPYQSGYISKENLERVSGGAAVVVESLDKGRIVHIGDNLLFRGHWLGSTKLFINALIMPL